VDLIVVTSSRFSSYFQFPTVVSVVYHLVRHSSVNTDVFSCDETCLVGTEIEHHVGDVQRIADTTDGLLNGIGAFIDGVGCVNYGFVASKYRCA
jgi:hypothetical protein